MTNMAAPSCSSSLALLLVVMAYYAATGAFAVDHVVGSDRRWTVPQSLNDYNNWANGQTFTVGDNLVFNFATNAHDVVEVTSTNYDACNFQNPIARYGTGPATVPLTTRGAHYFLCSVGTHCSLGQKMNVTVSSAPAGPTTPSPPSTTPPTTANPPASSSTPASPGPSSGRTPPNAAPSNGLWMAAITATGLAASVAALVL